MWNKITTSAFLSVKNYWPFWIALSIYFLIPALRGTVDPPEKFYRIDTQIPFIDWMIIPYYSYYFILFTLGCCTLERNKIILINKLLMFLCFFSYLIYLIWPVHNKVIHSHITENPFQIFYDIVIMNYMDINAFPSLHVAISSLISLLIGKEKRNLRWVFWSWSLLIALSTFLAKQHYFYDTVFGIVLAVICFRIYSATFKS